MSAHNINQRELGKLNSGEWANLQRMILNYKTEHERLQRLNELDSVNYNGCGIRWFDVYTKSLNDNKLGIQVEVSCWCIRKI